jgi:hypothetical protein
MTKLVLSVPQKATAPLRRQLGDDCIVCTKGHSAPYEGHIPETFFYEGSHEPRDPARHDPLDVMYVAGCLARLYRAPEERINAYSARILENAEAWMADLDISDILFRTGPHLPHEMAIYLVARRNNVRMGIFEETSYFDRAFMFPGIDQRSLPLALWSPDEPFRLDDRQMGALKDTAKLKEHYFGIFKTKRNSPTDVVEAVARAIAGTAKTQLKGTPRGGTARASDSPLRPSVIGALDYWGRNIAGILRSERHYFSRVAGPDIYEGLTADDVIFYGNYAPERTVFPDSYPYHDFLPALKLLGDFKKKIWREHPTQFTLPGKPYRLRGGFYKQPDFYQEVERLGWQIGPLNYPSESLIRSPVMIATLNGTVAFEAMLKKRPVILFARNWYRDLPNVSTAAERKFDLDYDMLEVSADLFARTFPRIDFGKLPASDLNVLSRCFDLIRDQNRIGEAAQRVAAG